MAVTGTSAAPKAAPTRSVNKTSSPKATSTAKAKTQTQNKVDTTKRAADTKIAERQAASAQTVQATREVARANETAAKDRIQATDRAKQTEVKRGLENVATKTQEKSEAWKKAGEQAKERTARLNKEFAEARAKDPTIAKGLPPGQSPDFRSHASEFPNKLTSFNGEPVRVQTNGPVTVNRNSGTLGVEGSKFNVSWQPLGPDGRIQTSAGPTNGGQNGGGHYINSSSQTFQPPYNNPHGWIATVSPQALPNAVNANSLGGLLTAVGS